MILKIATGLIAGIGLAALMTLGSGAPAQAQHARWCAHYDWSTTNCGFYTRTQCLATISGVGGYCSLGLNGPQAFGYVPGGEYPRHGHRRHHRQHR